MQHKLKNTISNLLLAGILTSIGFLSCIDEKISTDPSLKLSFSSDTLFFDTVFTSIGSATAKIKVHNPNSKNIKISTIGLALGHNSPYRLNVDGRINANHQFTNVELRAKDSLFVFVEVTIDPTSGNLPFIVKDSIIFTTNGNQQDIKLIAYGQDMEVIRNQTFKNDTTLTGTKPYVIYGDLVVDTAQTLRLAAGCRLYFHDGASLVIYGHLKAEGTSTSPVVLRGNRTDQLFPHIPYNFISNQWGGVLLLNKEGNHKLEHVQMNSGYVGIFFSNTDRKFRPKLEILNSRIHNFLKYGLVVQNGDLLVANTEISNTGSYSVYLNGGEHTFIHTTIANYFNSTNARIQPSNKEGDAALMIMELNRTIPMKTTFQNCIIAGSDTPEFTLLSRFPGHYNGKFANSYIRMVKPDPQPTMFTDIRWHNAKDTVFANTYFDRKKLVYYNFTLDSISPARDIGDYNVALQYQIDLNGNNRLSDGKPDAGAYEWQPTRQKK